MEIAVPALFVVIFVAALVARAVTVVAQDRAGLVERLGRYRRTLDPGLHMIVPILDKVRFVDLREQLVTVSVRPIPTRDDLAVSVDLRITVRVTDPVPATYEVASYAEALDRATRTSLRSIIGGLDREQTYSRQVVIGEELRSILAEIGNPWGLQVEGVEVTRIERDEDVGRLDSRG